MKKIILKKDFPAVGEKPAAKYRIRYGEELNEAQYRAVMHTEGPALVIAGAGSGKTRTLVYRVARLVEDGVYPESILLLTFTRKAAREMLRRAAALLDERTERVSGGTFHSFANLVLRRYAELLGFDQNFSILDRGDAEDVVGIVREEYGSANRTKMFPKKETLTAMISMAVNKLEPLEILISRDYPHFADLTIEIESLARDYVAYKRRNNLMDYDDLLVHLSALLEDFPEVQQALSKQYGQVMVDEYQDTNALQARIVRRLGGASRNVMVVGDDSQSIYSFRGASFRNIMDFPHQFPGCVLITLEENYRSTEPILDLTNEIIARAEEKYPKRLFTRRIGGDRPMLVAADGEHAQSRFIVQYILEEREKGTQLDDIAVLFRAAYQSFDLEIELTKSGIPYVKYGGFRLMETAHVKDLLSHLRVVHNPRDTVSWRRVLLLLPGVGPHGVERVIARIADGLDPFSPGSEEQLGKLVPAAAIAELFETLHAIRPHGLGLVDRMSLALKHYEPLLKTKYDDYPKRLKDLEMLVNISAGYETLEHLLTVLALEPPNESVVDITPNDHRERLTLSTVHSAKGLEWGAVIVMYLVDGRFPLASAAASPQEMEEERRLFYVACTRAKRNLVLTYPMNIFDRYTGTVLSKPSRFLEGIREDLVERFVVAET
ncbi:MAG: ATP-dependent helicase [Bacteroidota bacterium]|nr:ATP-dependent helicase [Bacteroidota bacterium]